LATTAAVAVSSAVFASVPLVPPPPTPIGLLVAAYTIGDRGLWWQRRVALGAGVPAIVLFFRGPLDGVTQPLIMLLGAYALGTVVRSRRGYAAALEVRARDLERERDIEAERATMAERARIAREMHDILGHAVSIMVVQAEAGPVLVRSDPDRAIVVFDAVASAGREALHQIQRLLGLLAGDDAEQLAPQPRLADLGRLLAGVRASGLAVTMATGGTPRGVPLDLEAAVFRMIQEAVTNTVKHAGATACAVRIDWTDDELLVQVRDDGRGVAAHRSAGGRGLVGVRERAAAFGGSAAAGPNAAGGGFTVAVRIPIPVPPAPPRRASAEFRDSDIA
jgi:signal transduction histidine kinase